MQTPHELIISYINNGLNQALEKRIGIDNFKDWNIKVTDDFMFFSTGTFKLTKQINMSVDSICELLAHNFNDSLNYFKNIKSEKGYINFILASDTCNMLLANLNHYLSHPNTNKSTVKISYNNNALNESLRYRINRFVKAKKNVLKAQGYVVKLNNQNAFNNIPFVGVFINGKNYVFNFLEICDNQEWQSLIKRVTELELNYLILSHNPDSKLSLNTNIMHNVKDPLYLLNYLYNNKRTNNIFVSRPIERSLIIKKLLVYPLKVELCSTNTNFREIFSYINSLTRLTFEYDLWQNCTEKITFRNSLYGIFSHCFEMLLR